MAIPRVCLDVGTTNTRAWLVDGPVVLVRRSAQVGVRDAARTGATTVIENVVRDLVDELSSLGSTPPDCVCAAGMITSPLGLAEVPHVAAPAGLEALARHVRRLDRPDLAPIPIFLVPGVRTGDSRHPAAGDVMRGEETLAIGAMASGALPRGGRLLTVGSHWKLISMDEDGRVARSRTSLGGETIHAWQAATLLRSSLPEGPLDIVDREWVAAGAEAARAGGLLRAAFEVRVLDLSGTTTPAQRLNWVLGATVAADLDAMVRAGHLASGMAVGVAGPSAVPLIWAQLLEDAGCLPVVWEAEATERAFLWGLHAILESRASCAEPR